ncbi:unnamed protein product [Bursaphelenchus okinawaensis]|uniref:Uncharacterized protein n=1 Tax=Bursaphelenchus okinawaensis TaxID=465554 RepID=A0A811LPV3_9BILA|nr:unnamed protein product [Bursaphelenchus okinawaensis]CAG9127709.1 unnamed protein product [Bursaphelenchus okinawaensis]
MPILVISSWLSTIQAYDKEPFQQAFEVFEPRIRRINLADINFVDGEFIDNKKQTFWIKAFIKCTEKHPYFKAYTYRCEQYFTIHYDGGTWYFTDYGHDTTEVEKLMGDNHIAVTLEAQNGGIQIYTGPDDAKQKLHKFTGHYGQIDLLYLSGPLTKGSIKITSLVSNKWYAPVDMTKRNLSLGLLVKELKDDFDLMLIGEQDIVMFYMTFHDNFLKFNSDTEGRYGNETRCTLDYIDPIELDKVSNLTIYIDPKDKLHAHVISNGILACLSYTCVGQVMMCLFPVLPALPIPQWAWDGQRRGSNQGPSD